MEDKNKQKPNGAPRNEGVQRISVRPGNFNPPSGVKPTAPAEGKNGAGNGGNSANHNRRNRNRHGRGGNRPHDNRPIEEGRAREAGRPQSEQPTRNNARPQNERPTQEERKQPQKTADTNASGEQRSNRNNRNRHGRRGGTKGERPAERVREPRNEQTLSSSLQRELDEEFGTPTLSSPVSMGDSKKRTESAVDSEEFAVDIATASYLIDDVPCGFPIPDGKAVEVVGVRFRQAGRLYFFAPNGMKFRIGERAIVDTARGPEIGDIVMLNRKIAERDVIQPLRAVLRRATPEDIAHEADNHAKELEALRVCEKKIATHKLDMHLVDAQYTFDNSKLLFYFTSDGRVDFRELVHDLASHFHTRIELRQIGIRDESRLIGGLGMCGRPFCCSTFLSDFGQVSVKMAKEQGLSINASKISGCCGRLMCCLRYEHETYVAESKLTPKKDAVVNTPDGRGTVVDSSPLAGTVRVRLDATPEEAPQTYHRDALTVLGKGGKSAAQAEQSCDTADPADAENEA